jgi:hypothetical protein
MEPTLDTFRTLIRTTQSVFTFCCSLLVCLHSLLLVPSQGAAHYLLTTSISDALVVVLPSTNIRFNLARNSFNILAVNPANSEWNYLGAAASIVGQNLEQAPSLALITGTKGQSSSLLSSVAH